VAGVSFGCGSAALWALWPLDPLEARTDKWIPEQKANELSFV
jgi:hypothetical protein